MGETHKEKVFCQNTQINKMKLEIHGRLPVLLAESGFYFPVFGLNTEIYSVNLCIQSKYGEIRTRETPNSETFHVVYIFVYSP